LTAHGAERYLRSGRRIFLDAKGERPFPIPLNLDKLIVHKIVVAHGAADACKNFSEQNVSGSLAIAYGDAAETTRFPFLVHIDKAEPVHVLDTSTLPILLSELDTIRDLSNYFDAKRQAIDRFDGLVYCGEEDLLAHYLFNLDEDQRHFIGTKEPNVNFILIAEGEWERLKALTQYEATKEANRASYLWDELINTTCDNFLKGKLLGDSDLINQRSAIHEMAKEPRFIRRAIADLMYEAIKIFPENRTRINRYMRYIPSFDPMKGYVFLQLWIPERLRSADVDHDRAKRQEILEIACGSAENRMPELHTVVGIGIEPPKFCQEIAEDFVLLDCADWSDERKREFEDRNAGFDFFKTAGLQRHAARIHEFVLPTSARPLKKASKPGRNEPCPCGSGKKFKRCHGR
jgi:SEC-C motif